MIEFCCLTANAVVERAVTVENGTNRQRIDYLWTSQMPSLFLSVLST